MDPSGSILYCDFYVKTGRVTLFFLWLPLLDEFRTQNWKRIKEEFSLFVLSQKHVHSQLAYKN